LARTTHNEVLSVGASTLATCGRGKETQKGQKLSCVKLPSSGVTRIFTQGEAPGTTNMFTKAGIHHRNVYIKKYDKHAHLISHSHGSARVF